MHSQVGLIRQILKDIPDKGQTLIVVPRPEIIIPLLSEISSFIEEFNVSMGYPFIRTPVYTLFNLFYLSQESKKDGKYYSKDYLNLLKHPLIKNLSLSSSSKITRILVHKIEEHLKGIQKSNIGGSLFISLEDIQDQTDIYKSVVSSFKNTDTNISLEECRDLIKKIHNLFFRSWQGKVSLYDFTQNVIDICDILIDKAMLGKFPFNLKALDKLYDLSIQLQNTYFAKESFSAGVVWEIMQQRLETEIISFSGSPLRGLQILGLFETRSLSFSNVIVADLNESVLPKMTIYEPLIPREVMVNLGLNRLEKEEEIQRYHFMRLIKGAKNVHLIYQESKDKEKSRFIEDILWDIQKEQNSLEPVFTPKARFNIKMSQPSKVIGKTPQVIESLKNDTYSASRLNTYLNCPLQFYYKYVLGIKEREDLLEGVESTHIGTFLHEFLEEAFIPFVNKKPFFDEGFVDNFFSLFERKFRGDIEPRMKADHFLLKRIMQLRLKRFLTHEAKKDIVRIVSLEERKTQKTTISNTELYFTYTADRIDELPGKQIVILDYKTGSSNKSPKKYSQLSKMDLSREAIKENIRSFQLPLYYRFISQRYPDYLVNAKLYNLRTLNQTPLFTDKDHDNKENIMQVCTEALGFILKELFNPDIPFNSDPEEKKCSYCPYNSMCI